MKNSSPLTKFLALSLGLSVTGLSSAQAASGTWNNASDNLWQTSANWTASPFPGATSGFASTDDATFSTTGASGTISLGGTINIRSLLFGVASGNAAAFTIGGATDTLNFTTAGGITINSGVTTAQNIGVAGTTINLSNAAGATATFTNNGSGLLTIAGNIAANAASGNGLLTVGGTGDTTVTGTITKPGAGSNALLKTGTGTLTLSNGSVWSGTGAGFPVVARSGTLLLNGGTHTVAGEAVIGGASGGNAKIQIDSGTLAIGFFSVGRGNSNSNSSDLVANNGAAITASDLSAGFVSGTSTITLNNTSSLTIDTATNGVFRLSESAGATTTMTLNDTAQLISNGTGLKYIGQSGTGTLILNGGSSLSFGSGLTSIGQAAGSTGSVTLNGTSTATLTSGGLNIGDLGTGTLTLNGTSTFTKTTGLVNVGTANGSVGTLNVQGGTFTTTSEIRVAAAGNGNNTVSGTVNVSSGTLNTLSLTMVRNGNNVASTLTGALNLSGTGIINTTSDTRVSFQGIGSTGTMNITGGTYNQGTTTNATIFAINDVSGIGTVNMSAGALKMDLNALMRFAWTAANTETGTFNQNGGTVTFYSNNGTTVGGTGSIDMMFAASTATNTYNLNGGTLTTPQVKSTNSTGSRTFNFNGGTLTATGSTTTFFDLNQTGTHRANVRDNGAIIDTNTFNVTIAEALQHSNFGGDAATDGGLTKNSAGILTLSGANTYTGATTVNAGTAKAGVVSVANVSGAFGNNSAVTMANVSGATLDITGFNTQIGSLAGGGVTGGNVTLGAATLTTGGADKSGSYAGVISGTGGLIKIGTGTQTLSGANTYTGGTTVNAGMLLVTNTSGSGTGTGAVMVNNSGSLLGGSGTISGAVSIASSGAILQGGNGTTGTTLTLTNNGLSLASGSILELALGASNAHSTLALAGGYNFFNASQAFILDNIQAGTYDNIITGVALGINTSMWTVNNGSGYNYTFSDDGMNIDLSITAVPEPSTWFACILALGTLGYTQRRRVRG